MSGFERTSTAEIARRAKVSKREIYTYFADKRTILSAAVADVQNEMQRKMSGIWSSSDEVEVVLFRAATILRDNFLSDRFGKLLRIVAAERCSIPQSAVQFYELGPMVGRRATAAYLMSQMKLGKLRKTDSLKAADDFLDLVIGAQLITALFLGQVDRMSLRRDHVKHIVEVFMKNFRSEGGGKKALS